MTNYDAMGQPELPHDRHAEEAVLGALFKRPSAITDVLTLKPEAFYDRKYAAVFAAMLWLEDRGVGIDLLTVNAELENMGQAEYVGGFNALAAIDWAVPSAANIVHYADVIRDRATRRRLVDAGSQIASDGWNVGTDLDKTLAKAEALVLGAKDGISKANRLLSPEQWTERYADTLKTRHDRGDDLAGISSGLVALDKITLGLAPGRLILIPARPGMGKSVLVGQVAAHAAVAHGHVAFFSLEMGTDEVAERLVAMGTSLPRKLLATGGYDDWQGRRAFDQIAELSLGRLHLAQGSFSVPEIRANCLRLQAEVGPLSLVVVDYAQLLTDEAGKGGTRDEHVGLAARRLKSLAQELKAPLLVPAQLNREVERRIDKRPILADLRESGSLEAEADQVVAIFRNDYYDPSANIGVAELVTLKQRHSGDAPGTSRRIVWDAVGEFYADSLTTQYGQAAT